MSEYLTEKEQLEQIGKWWAENRRFILGGIALGITILVGYNYYKTYTRTQAEQAGAMHQQLLDAVAAGDRDSALYASEALQNDYGSTTYAAQAPLALAKLYLESGDADAAAGALASALSAEGEIALIARLRLARVRLSQGDAQAALDLLDGVQASRFVALYNDVRGDAYQALDDKEAARDAYQSVLEESAVGVDRAFVRMKLESLGLPEES